MSAEATVRLMRSTPQARLRFALTVTAPLSLAGEECDKRYGQQDLDGLRHIEQRKRQRGRPQNLVVHRCVAYRTPVAKHNWGRLPYLPGHQHHGLP
jgi:hypothetical protein